MKAGPGGGDGKAAGRLSALREQAENRVRQHAGRNLQDLTTLSPAAAQSLLHDLQVHQIELELQNDELRQAQDALEASRARYFDLYNLAPVGYFTLDDKGFIVEANLTGATLLGVARGALITQPLSRFIIADDADNYYLHHRQLMRTGVPQAFELRMSKKDGAHFTAWVEATVAVATDGGAPACRVVISDISERKAMEERLRRKKDLLMTTGTMAKLGGWVIQLPHNELLWSDEVCAILDFPVGTVPLLDDVLALYATPSREILSAALAACARNGTSFNCELEMFSARRRPISVRAMGTAVRDESGNITGIEGAFQDITERREIEQARASLEAQLRESQKMEALGTLAGGIAHDFNNILGTILGNVDLARQDATGNWQALLSLDEIQKAGHRARDLVQQILSFSRRQPTLRRIMSLMPLVEESVRLLRAALPVNAQVEFRCAADSPSVLADPSQVVQVLLNLGINAADAMDGQAGIININVEGIALDAPMRSDLNLKPGRYARIVVSDTGRGMDAAIQRQIFEPFFTTKPAGKGTGLGLTVVHGIMQAHEGAIVVRSELGKGSRFELYFPPTHGVAAPSDPVEAVGPASEGHGRHVLVLDDDEAQMFMLKRMLERWGYHVSTYQAQRQAIEAVLAEALHFDLVVTDFSMPGISGLEVARAIHKVRPDLPMIMVSGYITDALRAEAAAAGVRELIAKPLDVEAFRDTLQRLAVVLAT